jgi:hypothetical protein
MSVGTAFPENLHGTPCLVRLNLRSPKTAIYQSNPASDSHAKLRRKEAYIFKSIIDSFPVFFGYALAQISEKCG